MDTILSSRHVGAYGQHGVTVIDGASYTWEQVQIKLQTELLEKISQQLAELLNKYGADAI